MGRARKKILSLLENEIKIKKEEETITYEEYKIEKWNNVNSFSSDNNSYINIGCCDNRSRV